MEEWKEYKVAEVIEDISMGPFGSNIKRENYVSSGVPYLNGSNLTSYKLNEDSFNYVTEDKAKSLGRCVAKRGDVIVTHRGTIGQISYIPYDSRYEHYLTGNSQFRLTVNKMVIRPDFFVYYFVYVVKAVERTTLQHATFGILTGKKSRIIAAV